MIVMEYADGGTLHDKIGGSTGEHDLTIDIEVRIDFRYVK